MTKPKAPAILVNETLYGNMTKEKVDAIFQSLIPNP